MVQFRRVAASYTSKPMGLEVPSPRVPMHTIVKGESYSPPPKEGILVDAGSQGERDVARSQPSHTDTNQAGGNGGWIEGITLGFLGLSDEDQERSFPQSNFTGGFLGTVSSLAFAQYSDV